MQLNVDLNGVLQYYNDTTQTFRIIFSMAAIVFLYRLESTLQRQYNGPYMAYLWRCMAYTNIYNYNHGKQFIHRTEIAREDMIFILLVLNVQFLTSCICHPFWGIGEVSLLTSLPSLRLFCFILYFQTFQSSKDSMNLNYYTQQ